MVKECSIEEVAWSAPRHDQLTLNVDGYSRGDPGRDGAAGLLKDKDANWVGGFTINLGIASANIAELRALYGRG